MFNRRSIELKKKLKEGKYSPGMWIWMPSPTACEIVAAAGLDWVVVDSEHSPFNPETLQHMLMAFKGSTTVPFIRVPWNNEVMIKQVLDMGWDGVVVPQVNTPDEVRRAVAACRYPPQGNRGFGPNRAAGFGRNMLDYRNLANDSVFCIIQIENVIGAEKIDEILTIPGIDGIFVGRWDMSAGLSRLGDVDCDEIWNACRKIFDRANKAGIPNGNAVNGTGTMARQKEMKNQLVVLGIDALMMVAGIDRLMQEFNRDVLGKLTEEIAADYYPKPTAKS